MVNEWEAASVVRDAAGALDDIRAQAERFAADAFSGGGWNDACGKRLGEYTVAVAEQAVSQHVDIYRCRSALQEIADAVCALIPEIEAAKKELS